MRADPKPAPLPIDEERRLAVLRSYQLLDTPSEESFDALVRLASRICDTPISLISLIDRDRQWFKAVVGLNVRETPREQAFCAHAILEDGIFEVADASDDARFADNPLVTGEPRIRFYAGVPLVTRGGEALGTLCVIDRRPRELTLEQRTTLREIADAVLEQFESRRAFLRLFDSSQAEIYHVDLHSQRVVFASEAARRNLGYELAELSTLPLDRILPALEVDGKFDARIELMRNDPNGRMTLQSVAQRRDGTRYPVELRLELMELGKRELALVFATDLSREVADRERVDLLSAAIDAAQDPIVIAEPAASSTEQPRYAYANDAFCRLKGMTAEQIVGKTSAIFDGPKTDRAALAVFHERLKAGHPGRVEFTAYRADGTSYVCEMTGRPLIGADGRTSHIVIVQRDVTEAALRGMTLELQNERLTTLTSIARTLFSALEPIPLVTTLLEGVRELTGGVGTLYARRSNGTFIETHDLTVAAGAQMTADPFLTATAGSDVAHVADDGRRAAVRVAGASGTTLFVLDIAAGGESFKTPDIFAIGLLGQYVSVAIRNVELYGELASRRAAVIELNQVKNDLIAMLAHDFKGPLTTIVGFAEVLAEDPALDSESRGFLNMISSSAMRLAGLATDTLALSRLEQNELTLRLEPVDVVALLEDVTRVFRMTRTIELRSETKTMLVSADPGRLRQVFENLIGNAIKYSPGGQPVDVTVRASDTGLEVAVRDRGIGIPDVDRSKLFGRFARASNARELGIGGTGFGLYLAKTIVEMHGGTIAVESREGAGSTFRVYLPAEPPVQRTASRRILLLDGEGDGRSYVAHTLRTEGFAVVVVDALTAVEALLVEQGFDAVVIDADRVSASEALALPALAGRIALVLLGGNRDADWPLGAHLAKPFLIKDLQAAIETSIARRAGASSPP